MTDMAVISSYHCPLLLSWYAEDHFNMAKWPPECWMREPDFPHIGHALNGHEGETWHWQLRCDVTRPYWPFDSPTTASRQRLSPLGLSLLSEIQFAKRCLGGCQNCPTWQQFNTQLCKVYNASPNVSTLRGEGTWVFILILCHWYWLYIYFYPCGFIIVH